MPNTTDATATGAAQVGGAHYSIHTVFSIETYDPSAKFDRWLMRLESAFRVFAVPNDKRADYLLHYMGAESYDLLCDKISPENPVSKTYEEIVKVMKTHYNPEPLEIAENFRFLQRKQGEGESAQEYLTALQRLATTCKFGNYLKKALRNQFVFGLRTQSIQGRLLEHRELTIEKALEIAVSMETSARDAAQLHNTNTSVNSVNIKDVRFKESGRFRNKIATSTGNQDVKTTYTRDRKTINKTLFCFRCGSAQHLANKCTKTNIFCNNCKVKGHLARVCMKKDTTNTNQIEEIFSIQTEHSEYRGKFTVSLQVHDRKINFEIDSGAAVSIMSYFQFKKLFPNLQIKSTTIQLITYCKREISVVGFSKVQCFYRGLSKDLNLYIVNTDRGPILGREWIRQLNITFEQISNVELQNRLQQVLERYPIIFRNDMGKIKNLQARLKFKDNIQPIFCKARKVPYALLQKVGDELDLLEKEGILVKVPSSEWATPIVPVLKSNGKIRICGDFKITLNKNLIVDEHPLPSIENLFSSMAGGDIFTKLDLQQAYLQLEVRPEDRKYLTLNTPKGLYQSTRLLYGIASAPAIWQREIENILKDIEGVSVFIDDIRITAPNDDTHYKRLELVLGRLSDYNIRVNYEKCQFMQNEIEYCGYIIDRNGIHKCKRKIDAMQNAKIPTNKSEVRAFVGLINYYGRFLQNLSTTLHPLYNLLKDGVQFSWDRNCQNAFEAVKKEILSERVLVHFDPKLPIVLATDASPYAVGAVLSHVYEDGTERPIQFASQTLTPVQQRYAQIDKEAYSIIFGIKKFYYFLFGRKFLLYTDHKPLLHIFSPLKSSNLLTTTRMQHYALFLQSFHYDIKYKNTKLHSNADAMSRLPANSNEIGGYDEPDAFEIFQIETLPITLKELARETVRDQNFSKLIYGLRNGKGINKSDRFNINQTEFTLQQDCLFRSQMAIIPKSLRDRVLKELHTSHLGITKMKQLARSYCWWPGITSDIENEVKNCVQCNKHRNSPSIVPIHPWETSTKPFDRVHVDFAGPFMNCYYFILVDSYSQWPEIHTVNNMTARNTIPLLRKIFSTFGIPSVLVSDNGPTFTSYEFKNFLSENGIIHKLSPPFHPATNGLAERCVQTFKKALRAMFNYDKRNTEKNLQNFLLHYRKSQHSITGESPSFRMFGREIRSRLDLLKPDFNAKRVGKEQGVKLLEKGKRVSAREYVHENKWEFGRVHKRLGQLIYLIKLDDGRIWKRHINQIRSIGENTPITVTRNFNSIVPVGDSTTFLDHDNNSLQNHNTHDAATPVQLSTNREIARNSAEVKLPDLPQQVSAPIPSNACTLRRSERTRKPPERFHF